MIFLSKKNVEIIWDCRGTGIQYKNHLTSNKRMKNIRSVFSILTEMIYVHHYLHLGNVSSKQYKHFLRQRF